MKIVIIIFFTLILIVAASEENPKKNCDDVFSMSNCFAKAKFSLSLKGAELCKALDDAFLCVHSFFDECGDDVSLAQVEKDHEMVKNKYHCSEDDEILSSGDGEDDIHEKREKDDNDDNTNNDDDEEDDGDDDDDDYDEYDDYDYNELEDFDDYADDEEYYEDFESEPKNCIKKNQDYILDCVKETSLDIVMTAMEGESDNLQIKCSKMVAMFACVQERTEEECGEVVSDILQESLSEIIPKGIRDTCEKAAEMDIVDLKLEEYRK